MKFFVVVLWLFCPFFIFGAADKRIVVHKKQRVVALESHVLVSAEKKTVRTMERELKLGKQQGDYASLLKLIDFYFQQERLGDVASELTDLISEDEVRPETIVHMDRLGDALRALCQIETAFAWYTFAEYEALTHTVMYGPHFGVERISAKKNRVAEVLASLHAIE